MRHSHRLQTLLLPGMTLALATAAAAGAAKGGTILLAVGACAVIIGLAVAVSLPPQHVFLGWLALAPFVQANVGSTGAGHALRVVVYSLPPLLFAFWAFTRRRAAELTLIDAMPLLYVVVVIMSVYFGQGHPGKTEVYSIVGVGVILYYFLAFGPVESDLFPKVARILLLTGSVSAAWVMFSRITGVDSQSYAVDKTTSASRAVGTFGSPAMLGTFLGAALILALTILAWNGPRHLRRLSMITIALSIPGIALTLTRGPQIAAGAVALLVLVMRGRTRWGTAFALAIVFVGIFAEWGVISSTHLYKSRFSNTSNVQDRVVLDRVAFNLIQRKPVFGWGYGSFDIVKGKANFNPAPYTRDEALGYTSHNSFLTILAETGIVGFCVLVVPWLVLARRTLARVRGAPEQWMLVAPLAILAVWLISVGTFDVRFFSIGAALPWLAAGLMRRLDLDRQTSGA